MPLNSLLRAFRSKDATIPSQLLRIAVIGAGRMGQFHLKHLSRNRAVILSGVADSDRGRSDALARKYKTTAYTNASELLHSVDAVIIATPTPTHYEMGLKFLKAGVSCFIEKPLASSLEEA